MPATQTEILDAIVDGAACRFDGARWTSTNLRLAHTLNLALELSSPPEPADIRSIALHTLKIADFSGRYQITSIHAESEA